MNDQKTGYLFPGQGAQSIGMGKDLSEAFEIARCVYEEADEILGYKISELCFAGSEEDLTRTVNAQPAIFVTSIAALRVLQEKLPSLKPSFAAGLSLGEFTALVAAGSITFQDGLKLVQKRAEAMEKAAKSSPGTMASVMGLNAEQCREVAEEAGCEVANLNAPDQIVLSGSVEAIEKACPIAEAKGAKRAIRLKVGGAFHSSLMAHAKEELEAALQNTKINAPECLFVPNVKAEPVSAPEEIRGLLSSQLTSPVRWVETMQAASDARISQFLEIGPGKVLKGLARRCQPEFTVTPAGTSDDISKVEGIFQVSSS